MLKKIFVLSALIFVIFASVGECWWGGIAKILIEEQTNRYITTFERQYYSESESDGKVYTKGKIIFDGDGVWRSFYAVIHAERKELLRLEIDGVLLFRK